LLHANLVFVPKYRRPVFTDAMLTFCERTMRGAYSDLDTELIEFNGETNHLYQSSSSTSTSKPDPSETPGSARRQTRWAHPGLKSEASA